MVREKSLDPEVAARLVTTPHGLVYVRDRVGDELAAVLMHGFPDDSRNALSHPRRIGHLVLLNTYYGRALALRLPEMIRLLADRHFTPLADVMMADKDQRLWLLAHTARQFGADPLDPRGVGVISVLPQFFGDGVSPDALPAIRSTPS